MPPSYRLQATVSLLLAAALLARCTLEEDFLTDPGTRVILTTDTLAFDTVFTAVGSATRSFKIVNPHDRPLSLASVRVDNDAGGRFRINVDGIAGTELTEVFVAAEDSIYVFAEVTVDPDAPPSVSPFVLEGRVVVTATTEEQSVLLQAFGQNANYLPADRRRGGLALLTCELGEVPFDDPRPYVLYGSLAVDSCTLVLPPGARLYVHGGLVANPDPDPDGPPSFNDGQIVFLERGRLRIDGTPEAPVLIASDRLEERFVTRAGQYSGIFFLRGSGPHVIRHADIRNAFFGAFVDSSTELTLEHTRLRYHALEGIRAVQARVAARNVLIHSTGGPAFAGLQGGDYALDYCTLVNYGGREPAGLFANGFEYNPDDIRVGPLDVRVRNSILYGSSPDAIALVDFERDAPFDYDFARVLTRVTELSEAWPTFRDDCASCLYPERDEPLFVNVELDSFQLDTLSVAEMRAAPLPEVTTDIDGAARDDAAPDLGAYERGGE